MSEYPAAETTFAAADARIELALQIYSRLQPLEEGSPQWLYLTDIRKLPADVVRTARSELRQLTPLIEGRSPAEYSLVSLLRDASGEASGLQLTFLDIRGRLSTTEPRRQTYALRPNGVRDALFRVPGSPETGDLGNPETPQTGFLAEGFCEKPLALAAAGLLPSYGWGGLTTLGYAIPPEPIVVVVPDKAPADEAAAALHARAMRVGLDRLVLAGREVQLAPDPDCAGRCCKDADDYLRRHGPGRLAELVGRAETGALSLDGEAVRLAKLADPLERDRQTTISAKRLGIRVAVLREAVRRHHDGEAESAVEDSAGAAMVFKAVEPADHPVTGAELLDTMVAAVREYVFADPDAVTLIVLWVVHTHRRFHGNIGTLPRLVITAAMPDSGKTVLATAAKHMTDTAEHTTSPRAANIYRSIEAHSCAFFLDEADEWYARSEELREIINSGFNKDGASVLRCEDVGRGDKRVLAPRRFSTFAPMAIIGNNLDQVLNRTVLSRALVVHMRPARAGEVLADIYDNPPAVRRLHALASQAKRWVMDSERELAAATPERPEGVINRLWLVWRPLLTIADQAGGEWPRRAREALSEARARTSEPGLAVQLLVDIRDIMQARSIRKMHTKDLIEQLVTLELRNWATYGRARVAIRDTDVADLLRPYEVQPEQIKIGAINRRGYSLAAIEAALERYGPITLAAKRTEPRYARYPATGAEKPKESAGLRGSGSSIKDVPTTLEGDTSPDCEGFPGKSSTPSNGQSSRDAEPICEEKQSGSGVAVVEGDPYEVHRVGALNDACVCATCGKSIEHTPGMRGPLPMECPACRQKATPSRITGIDTTPGVRYED